MKLLVIIVSDNKPRLIYVTRVFCRRFFNTFVPSPFVLDGWIIVGKLELISTLNTLLHLNSTGY